MEIRKLNSNVSVLQPKKAPTPNPGHHDYVKKVHRRRMVMIGIVFALILVVFGVQIFNAHRTYANTM